MRTIFAVVVAVLATMVVYRVGAQTTPAALTITAQLPHTLCPAASSGVTQFCFATDGLWQSLAGGAYTQVGAVATAGVTSFNGRTGAVIPAAGDYSYALLSGTPPVASVNGKTGSVILGATTTLQ